jgi:mRNA interferase MazF
MPHHTHQKLRPVLVLKILSTYEDLLVCTISSQVNQYISGLDLLLDKKHPAFAGSGLNNTSIIRLANLYTFPQRSNLKVIGFLPDNYRKSLLNDLARFLLKED